MLVRGRKGEDRLRERGLWDREGESRTPSLSSSGGGKEEMGKEGCLLGVPNLEASLKDVPYLLLERADCLLLGVEGDLE